MTTTAIAIVCGTVAFVALLAAAVLLDRRK
jgi:hypothetical protein